jgi:hypothetical protein
MHSFIQTFGIFLIKVVVRQQMLKMIMVKRKKTVLLQLGMHRDQVQLENLGLGHYR